jgi:hypothetical protein
LKASFAPTHPERGYALEWTEYRNERHVHHVWRCWKCDCCFETITDTKKMTTDEILQLVA